MVQQACRRFDVIRSTSKPSQYTVIHGLLTQGSESCVVSQQRAALLAEVAAERVSEASVTPCALTAAQPFSRLSGADLQHPLLLYGTYKVGVIPGSATGTGGITRATGHDPAACVVAALNAGYRAIDCAQFYANERDVGRGLTRWLQETGTPRSELFIVTKVWNSTIYAGADAVRGQVRRALDDLEVAYLDMVLVHWPVPCLHVDAYGALQRMKKEGLIKAVGVSNYTIEDFNELEAAGLPPPEVNQIELNPLLYRRKTIDFFQSRGVLIQAYRPLANGKGVENEVVRAVADAHGRTPAQVMCRWVIQKRAACITKTVSAQRMAENKEVFGWTLSQEDLAKLDTLTSVDRLLEFRTAYLSGIVRDTPLASNDEFKERMADRDITLQ
eukprot:TRINITY_DN5986_c0_g1_i3.p1 TRINITY_DN5986_c0_g1~~TRINITY_DN5986_c0_g1_i3.p1  ORF type:complete len:386 (+),score=116.56 TRINITY_DN5986_c0_g1_i3:1463-2620(+)